MASIRGGARVGKPGLFPVPEQGGIKLRELIVLSAMAG